MYTEKYKTLLKNIKVDTKKCKDISCSWISPVKLKNKKGKNWFFKWVKDNKIKKEKTDFLKMGQIFEKILHQRRKMDDKYSNGCSLLLGKWKLEV